MNTETWVLEKTESAMFKDDMLPLTENQEKTSSLPSLLNFNESRKVNSRLSSFFNNLEEKREYCLIVSLIRGFNEPEPVHAQLVFSHLESLKTPKKTPGGSFLIQFSLLRPEKYKTNHRITLLAFKEARHTFLYLIRKV